MFFHSVEYADFTVLKNIVLLVCQNFLDHCASNLPLATKPLLQAALHFQQGLPNPSSLSPVPNQDHPNSTNISSVALKVAIKNGHYCPSLSPWHCLIELGIALVWNAGEWAAAWQCKWMSQDYGFSHGFISEGWRDSKHQKWEELSDFQHLGLLRILLISFFFLVSQPCIILTISMATVSFPGTSRTR